jgi:hypothetical protein
VVKGRQTKCFVSVSASGQLNYTGSMWNGSKVDRWLIVS